MWKIVNLSRAFIISVQILFIVAINNSLNAQEYDLSKFYSYGENFFYQMYYYPTPKFDSIEVVYIFRIRNELLTFNQSENDDQLKGKYYCSPLIEMTFKDDTGIIRNRAIWTDTIFIDNFDLINSKTSSISGAIKINLKMDDYKTELLLSDQTQVQILKEKMPQITISESEYRKHSFHMSNPIFTEEIGNDFQDEVYPYIMNDKVSFEKGNSNILFILSYDNTILINSNSLPSIEYTITKQSDNKFTLGWTNAPDIIGKTQTIENTKLELQNKLEPSGKVSLLAVECDSNQNQAIINIPLSKYDIIPGNYLLELIVDGLSDTLIYNFEIVWEQMPLSLYKVKYAVKMMYYLLDEEEFEKLNDGDDKEMYIKFNNYWRSKDPSPGTNFNEAMAQYFQRVDFAFFNFKTTSEQDGALTERGKIYILKGQPDKIDRELTDDGSLVTWIYSKQGKKYTFKSKGSEKFRLIKIDDL